MIEEYCKWEWKWEMRNENENENGNVPFYLKSVR